MFSAADAVLHFGCILRGIANRIITHLKVFDLVQDRLWVGVMNKYMAC